MRNMQLISTNNTNNINNVTKVSLAQGNRIQGALGKQGGLTLLEMLVVFLLTALLSTLLIQGIGYFLAQYQAVQRFQGKVSAELLSYNWFNESVQAMIPYDQAARRFSGDARSFQGFSMQALAAEPGLPVEVSWTLSEEQGARTGFLYAEEGQDSWEISGPVSIRHALGRNATGSATEYENRSAGSTSKNTGIAHFEYADSEMNWHAVWPPTASASLVSSTSSTVSRERIPSMIGLRDSSEQLVWLSRLVLFPRAVVNNYETE
ncbi:MAG: hypothetical protein KUG75_04575 [Pseudomonadales bacterium]|nr:hypothetical protein [Pseudomonadales bacterium]